MKTLNVRPLLVESKEITNLWSYKGRKLYYDQANFNDEDETIYYQLILISLDPDEKIENCNTPFVLLGEWSGRILTMRRNGTISSTLFIDHPYNNDEQIELYRSDCKKVIATQSQLSPEYISKFVEEYNSGYVKDLVIEMFNDWNTDIEHGLKPMINSTFTIKPKLTSEGYITIVEKEPIMYSEEEVYNQLEDLMSDIQSNGLIINDKQDLKLWFNDNKKK